MTLSAAGDQVMCAGPGSLEKSQCVGTEAGARAKEGWCPAGPGWPGSGFRCPDGRSPEASGRYEMRAGLWRPIFLPKAPSPRVQRLPWGGSSGGRRGTSEEWNSARLSVYLKTAWYLSGSDGFGWPELRHWPRAARQHHPGVDTAEEESLSCRGQE